jgi:hypothetical protein
VSHTFAISGWGVGRLSSCQLLPEVYLVSRLTRSERYSRQWDDYVYKANNTSGNASQHRAYPTFDPEEFAERVRRETRYTSGSNWQDDDRPNPQPEMAKVWLTQARNALFPQFSKKYICENISKEGRDINTAIYYKLNIVYGLFVLSLFTVALRLLVLPSH